MALRSFAAPLFLWFATESVQVEALAPVPTRYCGGEIDVVTIDRYFSDLRQALANPGPKTRFNAFVNSRFGVTSARGRTLYFDVSDIGSVTPGRITLQEWREISRRGPRSLHSAGWRGCFMDHGKVWFEGSREHGFRLRSFARDMPWVAPAGGDVAP